MNTDKWKFFKYVKALDDFNPSFEGGLVRCSINLLSNKDIHISVWGDDDYGLEKIITFDNKGDAKTAFRKLKEEIKNWNNLTISNLKKNGFKLA